MKRAPSYFITGSGTGVGKTFVTAALVCAAARAGTPVRALKPLVSGFDPQVPAGSDPDVLAAAMDHRFGLDEIVAQWFAEPLSPDHAAARAGVPVDVDALARFVERAASGPEPLLVEGVGGVLVPLNGAQTVRDWMKAVGFPAVVVTSDALGTLSHTLCALEVLKAASLEVRLVVVNQMTPGAPDLDDTLRSLRAHGHAPVAPYRGPADGDAIWAALRATPGAAT